MKSKSMRNFRHSVSKRTLFYTRQRTTCQRCNESIVGKAYAVKHRMEYCVDCALVKGPKGVSFFHASGYPIPWQSAVNQFC